MKPFSIISGYSSQHLLGYAEVVLVIVLALALADFAWLLSPGAEHRMPAAEQRAPRAGAVVPGNDGKEARRLSPAVLSLFGQPGTSPGVPPVRHENIRETDLDLILKGILASRSGNRKLALISTGGEKEAVFRIGNLVAGAEITHIEARRVILKRRGGSESLTLETAEPRRGNSFNNRCATTGRSGPRTGLSSPPMRLKAAC